MSPLRSIAGPGDRADADAELVADDVRERRLAEPGGPASRTWSSASPRPFAASSAIESCSLTRSWPTKSASERGRSERSSSSSSGLISGARNCVVMRPSRSAAPYLLLRRKAGIDLGERALRVDEAEAELDSASRAIRSLAAGRVDGRAELLLQLEHDPLRGLLADAGDRLEARRVVERDRAPQLGRGRAGDDRERDLGPDAVDAQQVDEEVALLGGPEAVELERVFADVEVGLDGQLVAGAPQHRRRRLDEVADAVHVEDEARPP